jgi:hypothetical protein
VAADSARTRSAWLTAISATKTHGELVSKAWSALGGDCAAEVVQLMSLANDWEDLILAGVGLDYVPEKSTLGLRASQRRLLERGGMHVAPQQVQVSARPVGGSFAASSDSLAPEGGGNGGMGGSTASLGGGLPTGRSSSGLGGMGGSSGSPTASPPLGAAGEGGDTATPLLAARALSGESGGVKERIANRARMTHAAGIEHRISAKVRAVLEREEATVARREKGSAGAMV